MDWLLAPIDQSRIHDVSLLVAWHGRMMVLAWGVLLPLGMLVARFLKITPKQDWPRELDNHCWWYWHLGLQTGGAVVMLFGLILILNRTDLPADSIHWYLGWAVFTLGLVQILSGFLRGTKGGPTEPAPDGSVRGDHFDMTRHRKAFEYFHKFMGYAVLLLSLVAVITGMWHANAPVWMWLGLAGWWCVLLVVFGYCQLKGMAVDTYQAIWGADEQLPGNTMKPIGFGVCKPKPKSCSDSGNR